MSFAGLVVSSVWVLLSAVVYLVILLFAARKAYWPRLLNIKDLSIYFYMLIGVGLAWLMKAGIDTTLNLHLLGATLLTLMFGWAFALIGLLVILVGITLVQGDGWLNIPIAGLAVTAIPVFTSYGIFLLTRNRLPNNFFIYIFIAAFFGAALAIGAVIFATTLIYYLAGTYSFEYMQYNYFRYAILLMFPEAFLTGMLMSIFVAFRPEWVSTFDDRLYLRNK